MASKSNGLESSEWARGPPPSGPLWERIAKAIYDPADKSFLGRTPKRWAIAITFYLVFYAVLAVMFSICFAVLMSIIPNREPMYKMQESLIGTNPGMDSRPRAADGYKLVIDVANTTGHGYYTKELDDFLERYQDQLADKKECVAADNYGFPETPCFFIKLNKIYGWVPEVLDTNALPEDMLPDLSEYITSLQPIETKQIWISCWDEGSNSTSIEYPWGRGLPRRFYPYLNSDGYLSPLVVIKVTPPVNKEVAIRCRAWAKNIEYNKSLKEPSGYTRILLQINNNTE